MTAPAPKRPRRLRSFLIAFAILALLAALLFPIILPVIARSVIASRLASAGLPNASFQLSSATLSHATLENLLLAPGSPHILPRVDISYSLLGLLRGRLNSIRISNALWHINADPSAFSLNLPGSTLPSSPSLPSSLPLNAIALNHCSLIFHSSTQSLEVPLTGTLLTSPVLSFTADSTLAGHPLTLSSQYQSDRFSLSATLAGSTAASAPASAPLSLSASFTRAAPASTTWNSSLLISLPPSAAPLVIGPATLGPLSLDADASFDPASRKLHSFTAAALFSTFSLHSVPVSEFQFSAALQDDSTIRVMGFAKDAAWSIPSLVALVPTSFASENGQRNLLYLNLAGSYTLPPETNTLLQRAHLHAQSLTLDSSIFATLTLADSSSTSTPLLDRLALQLDSIDLHPADPALTLNFNNLSAQLNLGRIQSSGRITPRSASFEIPAATLASITRADVPNLSLTPLAQTPLASLQISSQSAHLTIPFSSDFPLQFSAPSLLLTLHDLNLRAPALDLLRLRASIPFSLSADSSALSASLAPAARVTADRLQPLNSRDQPIDFYLNSPSQPIDFALTSPQHAALQFPFNSSPSFSISAALASPLVLGTSTNRSLAQISTLSADLALSPGSSSSSARLALQDVSFALPQQNLSLSNLSTDLRFTDLLAPRSAPAQLITADSFSFHDLSASSLALSFSLESPELLSIHSFDATLVDGASLSARNASYNPRTGFLSADLSVSSLSLRQWLPLLTQERATGQGSLSGSLSFSAITRGSPAFNVSRAEFSADPPHGFIQAADPSFIASALENADPRYASDDRFRQIKDQLVDALADFEFTQFRYASSREQNLLTSVLTLKGQGRTSAGVQPVNLTVDFPVALDAVLHAAFAYKSFLDLRINDQLADFFDSSP